MEKQFEGLGDYGVHVGHNIASVRRSYRWSQLELAGKLEEKRGRPVSQQLMSDIENKKEIDDDELLKQLAECLSVAPDFLREADYEKLIQIVSNTFNNHPHAINPLGVIHTLNIYNSDALSKQNKELNDRVQYLEEENRILRERLNNPPQK